MTGPALRRRTFLGLTVAASLGLVACSDQRQASQRFAVPLDTTRHTGTWMGWPDSPAIWGRLLPGAQSDIARIAVTIARYEPVHLLANKESAKAAARACGPKVTIVDSIPIDDCWLRDSGPIFRVDGTGGMDAVGLNFNGWGGRQTHQHDAQVAARIAQLINAPFHAADFVGEGGAIETDGAGTLMATASSLVNDNRNPRMSQSQVETAMCDAYGATKVIWFDGLRNDDITDDHVDATSRFLAPGRGLVQLPHHGDTDIWSDDERKQHAVLSDATDAHGRRIVVQTLQGPNYRRIRSSNPNFVGSYANYYVCNDAVVIPEFGDTSADQAAKEQLTKLFPDRTVEQIRIDSLGAGGGGIHCVTQQQPVP
jgi:agmatine deiminase